MKPKKMTDKEQQIKKQAKYAACWSLFKRFIKEVNDFTTLKIINEIETIVDSEF